MAKIQIIAAMTMDGFLPKADESLMQWVMNDAKGFPYWHEQSVYRLMQHYPLLDLLAEMPRNTPTTTNPIHTSLKYPTRIA